MSLIFCLPHAGGGAHHYAGWAAQLGDQIEWVPMDYAAHFSRMDEYPYETFTQSAHDLATIMVKQAAGRPFALFGHSMGGALVYEIACYLEQQFPAGRIKFVVISSALPPHCRDENGPRYYTFSDREFIQHLIDTGGLSAQLAEQKELMAHCLPLIRKDYQLYHQYQRLSPVKLNCPLYILWGEQENIPSKKMAEWSDYSHHLLMTKTYPAGHFYWHHCLEALTADLSVIAHQLFHADNGCANLEPTIKLESQYNAPIK